MDHRDNHAEPRLSSDAMASLGDERLGPELEDRVVAALRERNLLRASPAVGALPSPRRRVRAGWLVGASAAGLAFWIGLRAGEVRAERSMTRASAAVAAGRGAATANEVREAAGAYAESLSRVRTGDLDGTAAAIQGFRAASTEIMRLAPDSPLALAMQVAFPTSFAVVPARVTPSARQPAVIWF